MFYVKNQRNGKEIYDATTNLAIEYFLLNEKKLDEPILLFYINENAIIIGKNQNTIADFCFIANTSIPTIFSNQNTT